MKCTTDEMHVSIAECARHCYLVTRNKYSIRQPSTTDKKCRTNITHIHDDYATYPVKYHLLAGDQKHTTTVQYTWSLGSHNSYDTIWYIIYLHSKTDRRAS